MSDESQTNQDQQKDDNGDTTQSPAKAKTPGKAGKGTAAAADAPAPPQVIVQMVTPQATDMTEGLSETTPGGEYMVPVLNEKGKTVMKRVDAEGQPLS